MGHVGVRRGERGVLAPANAGRTSAGSRPGNLSPRERVTPKSSPEWSPLKQRSNNSTDKNVPCLLYSLLAGVDFPQQS